jgi:molybdate transport system ATP-binding protein
VTLSTAKPEHLSVRTTLTGTVATIDTGEGPLASVLIELDGHGKLLALATRKAIDEMRLRPGDQVYALVKTVALDERAVAEPAP